MLLTKKLVQNLYENALTLLKDDQQLLPLQPKEVVYYLALEEAPSQTFVTELKNNLKVVSISPKDLQKLPKNSKVIIGIHKDNSTAYKPYKISESSKEIIANATRKHRVILTIFGSPYALQDIDTQATSTLVVAYENNSDSQKAAVNGLMGKTPISGRLPVLINQQWEYGSGITLEVK